MGKSSAKALLNFQTITLLFSGFLGFTFTQAAHAQGYSGADTPANTTQVNAWQDFAYIQGQQTAAQVPGTLRAPLQQLSQGLASTYKGNTGQYLRGQNLALNNALPQTLTGLNAISGGYTGNAGAFGGAGGFQSNGGYYEVAPPQNPNDPSTWPQGMVNMDSSYYMPITDNGGTNGGYNNLPATSTSVIVDLNVAQ